MSHHAINRSSIIGFTDANSTIIVSQSGVFFPLLLTCLSLITSLLGTAEQHVDEQFRSLLDYGMFKGIAAVDVQPASDHTNNEQVKHSDIAGGESGIAGGESGIAGGESGIAGGESGIAGGESGIAGGERSSGGGELGENVRVEDEGELIVKVFHTKESWLRLLRLFTSEAGVWVRIPYDNIKARLVCIGCMVTVHRVIVCLCDPLGQLRRIALILCAVDDFPFLDSSSDSNSDDGSRYNPSDLEDWVRSLPSCNSAEDL
ncbi:hypothetical protein BDY19DRAFT_991491 [Irpex rosettiformis]|uniref:Uncharacterized protein n=1 Tax=Irpex rosettiformis TaxID=378272 RepID=A0ACB8UC21_9APHY|nr:hypothetical protein BDY19DRAFT_991491 [Irpex rosettiformis]